MQDSFCCLLLCELITKNTASEGTSLRPPFLSISFHQKGSEETGSSSGCVWPWLCVSAEGVAVSQWLLFYVEPRPLQETHSLLKPLENCSLKALCLKAALKGYFALGRIGDCLTPRGSEITSTQIMF